MKKNIYFYYSSFESSQNEKVFGYIHREIKDT